MLFLDERSRVFASLSNRSCIGEHQFYEKPDTAYPYDNLSPRDQGIALFFRSNIGQNSSEKTLLLGEMQTASTGTLNSDQEYSLANMYVDKKEDCTEDIDP